MAALRKVLYDQWNTIDLADLLTLEPVGPGAFDSRVNQLNVSGTVYGGQALAQAVAAACGTVTADKIPHSAQGFFLRPGDGDRPVRYEVTSPLDGRRFAVRQVIARQDDRVIFQLTVSFHQSEPGFSHQRPMPAEVPPADLPDLVALVAADPGSFPPFYRHRYTGPAVVEIRPIDPAHITSGTPGLVRRMWMRARVAPRAGDRHQQCGVIAYLSDMVLNGISLAPPHPPFPSPTMRIFSLNHTIWFHRAFRADEWLLHDTISDSAQDGRGLSRGYFYTRTGDLVATMTQEALFRPVS